MAGGHVAPRAGRAIRAAVMPAPRAPVELRELPWPAAAPGGAVLRVLHSEVCGTDVHLHHGRLAGVPYPIVPGHVSVGHLAEVHGPLHDLDGAPFREGDLVTFLDVHGSCGACHACLVTKQSTRCPHRRVYGITFGVADGPLGGWADHVWVKPGTKLLRIPAGVDPLRFIAGGCGLVTAVHAVERGGVRLGHAVVVLGAGPVGLAAAALSALSGAWPVIVVGAPAERLAVATRLGATHTVPLEWPEAERADAVRRATGGRGADVVIEAAGDPRAVPQALDLVRDGGVAVVAGQYTDGGDAAVNPHAQLNRKHAEVRGCWGCDFSHVHRALDVLAHRGAALPWDAVVSRQYPLEEAGAALAAVAERRVVKAVISPGGVRG